MAHQFPSAPSPIAGAPDLAPFVAELVPPTPFVLPEDEVLLRGAECTFAPHPDLPEVAAWGYGVADGPVTTPGAALEVPTGQPTHLRMLNDLHDTSLPFEVVVTPPGEGESPQLRPGLDGVAPFTPDYAPIGWLTTHLHGSHSQPEYDGWTDQMRPPGDTHYLRFANDDDNADIGLNKVGPALWYHDHAMNATRLHVYAGLAAPYIIRHPREAELGLPTSPESGEAALFIQDRNFHATDDGQVRLLHKTTTDTSEFFGPYTVVNSKLWPTMKVTGEVIRLRIYSGANARFFRLHVVDEDLNPINDRVQVIGTDGGLLWRGHRLDSEKGITLACAERVDLLVDIRGLAGQRLVIINSANAPFPGDDPRGSHGPLGEPRTEDLLGYPQVMSIDVLAADDPEAASVVGSASSVPGAVWDAVDEGLDLNPDHRRLVINERDPKPEQPLDLVLPDSARHRLVLLSESEETGMLLQTEVGRDDDGNIAIALPGEDQPHNYRALAAEFYDTITILPVYQEWEVWHYLNTTGDTHPMHIHQSFQQPLGEAALGYHSTDHYDQLTQSTSKPMVPTGEWARRYDLHETNGWKDTIRVNPNSMVSIAIRFDLVGRYVYHCHMIEHEDSAMMRPIVVTPVDMGMGVTIDPFDPTVLPITRG